MKRLITSFKRKDKNKGYMKLEEITCAFLIVILVIAFTVPFSLALPEQTKIYVDPPRIIDKGISPSQNITVDIMVANVTDLYLWQVKIYYNATILNVTDVSLPPNHVFAGHNYFGPEPVINNTEGYVLYGLTLLWVDPLWTFDGTGVLCQFSFRVKDGGYTPINFSRPYGEDTKIRDRDLNLIFASTEDGSYEYKYAVVNLEVKPNQHIADKLETFDVEVWLNNVTESDRVIGAQFRLQYNATLLAVKNVSEGPFFREFKSCPEEPYTQFVWYNITSRDEDPQNYDLLGPHILVSVVILSYEGQYSVFPNGSGILATVTFRGIYRSLDEALNSPLELSDIIVVDDAKPEPNVIATTSPINGYYEISPMQPPTADFTFAPDFPIAEQSVTFNASSSYDLDGYIVSYVWDFGDGNTTTVTSSVITHSYTAPDTYNVTLTVIDNDELSDSDAKTVIVEAQPVDILLYVAIIAVLATIVIAAAIVIYFKRIRKYKSRTV